jgi:hypothetical protein
MLTTGRCTLSFGSVGCEVSIFFVLRNVTNESNRGYVPIAVVVVLVVGKSRL